MSNAPLVSVIVPAYNCAKYIPETLSSLFEQDYDNIEIIVVNDGSKDNTLDILKTYGDKVELIDQANTGAPGARNNGIRAARGNFISFCDSDDLWAPQKVREQVEYFKDHPNVGMVCAGWQVWNQNSEGKFVVPDDFASSKSWQEIDADNSGWVYHKLLLDCLFLTSAVMLRKETIDKIGFFDTDLWNGDDYDYWIRTSRITEIHKFNSQRVLYRILPHGVSRTPTQINYGYEVISKAIARWGVIGPNGEQIEAWEVDERLARLNFEFGYLHLKSGDAVIAVQSFWNAIKKKPISYLAWVYLLLGLWKRLGNPRTRPAL